jgi:hypothetical protein
MRDFRTALLCVSLALAGCVEMPFPPQQPQPEPKTVAEPAKPKPPTQEQVTEAFTRLNGAFQKEYERILAERGTRTVQASRSEAFSALHAGLARLGMIVESRDPDAGTLTVAAPAPKPLSAEEWQRTVQADAPMMGAILCPLLGAYCKTIRFEPDDYVIVINATVLPAGRGASEVSVTTRMREIAPRPGVPRRDYPPPTGVRMALDKIWGQLEQQLAAAKPRR